jgi:Uma2 family endonuclease
MRTRVKRLTVAEFERLPEEEGYRLELVRGMVVREPGPGELHGAADVNLTVALHTYVREHRLGRVLTNVGFVLYESPGTVRFSDIAFVKRERLKREPQEGILRMSPDLAIEVLSPSNRPAQMRDKVADYLDTGAAMVWVVDAKRRIVTVHRRTEAEVLSAQDTLGGGDVIAGWSLPVSEIFRYE